MLTIMNMPTAPAPASLGQKLMRWLDPYLKSHNLSIPALGKRVSFDSSNFHKWRAGTSTTSDIMVFREIANALDVSLLTVLDAIGMLTKEEKAGIERVEVPSAASIEEAIDRDSALKSDQKNVLLAVYRSYRQTPGPATVKNVGRPRRK